MSKWALLFTAWVLACIATAGSLFFSDVMNYPPCALCWYQRIFMYPLTVILLPAVIVFEKNVLRYSLPLVAIGWLISIYHNLVYYGIVPESLSPCSMGASCKAQFLQLFGFIDIPQLSLFAFTCILMALMKLRSTIKNEK